jgi:hypothetical protein
MAPDPVAQQKQRRARAQAEKAMLEAARARQPLTYTQLVNHHIDALSYKPYDPALTDLLCAISRKSNAQGRGLLSAVVIHEGGDRLPGKGFFDLARELGMTVDDDRAFWAQHVQKVYIAYGP